jgi:hypothetical protein
MDIIPNKITIIVFAQGVLVLLWLLGNSWRRRRENALAAEPVAGKVPLSSQPLVWVVGTMVGLPAFLLLLRPCNTWYWSRHPPTIEHRSELLDTASKALHCPAEQLTIKPFGDTGADVTGCDRTTRSCWGRSSRYEPNAWTRCYTP